MGASGSGCMGPLPGAQCETTNFRAQEHPRLARERGGGRHAQLQTQKTYGLAAIWKKKPPLPRERRKKAEEMRMAHRAPEGSPALRPAPAPEARFPAFSLPLVCCPRPGGRLP